FRSDLGDAPIVWFAWPGGGYTRRYYDLQLPGRTGYSQAEHLVARGAVLVACDHVGVGDSAIPEGAFDHSEIARTSAAAARIVVDRLRAGALDHRLPALPNLFPVAMGQSYGGLLLTFLQAEHRLFQGVAMLGWSAIGTRVKDNSGAKDVPRPADMQGLRELNEGLSHPYRRSFHFDDVPEDIVAEDMRGYPARIGVPVPAWAAVHMPGGPRLAPLRGPLEPGVVAEEAASIDVPVFVAAGEIDAIP